MRRKRLRVGSTWLWQQAQRDLMARSPFKRLVLQLPLILQALALLERALGRIESLYAPEIAYRWHWQMGKVYLDREQRQHTSRRLPRCRCG